VAAAISIAATVAPTLAEPGPKPSAAIGKPFQLSPAITEFCAVKPPAMMCEAFEPQLKEFLAETRDPQWAAQVEPLIAKSMLVKGRSWAEIRSLECRRTRCALEYAVSTDDLNHDADGNQELDRLMEPTGGVVVPEVSPGGGGKIVSVLLWRKR